MQKKIKIIEIFKFIFFILIFSAPLLANENNFLTLRNEKVNLRQGPSFDHPIKLFYKKKYLPVKIIDQFDNFRKILDHENNSGWIHISQLSKRKAGINIRENALVFNSPTLYSKPIVRLEKGKLCIVKKCKDNWCKISLEGYQGWIEKDNLWGLL